jgi:hypothetical protein
MVASPYCVLFFYFDRVCNCGAVVHSGREASEVRIQPAMIGTDRYGVSQILLTSIQQPIDTIEAVAISHDLGVQFAKRFARWEKDLRKIAALRPAL